MKSIYIYNTRKRYFPIFTPIFQIIKLNNLRNQEVTTFITKGCND